MPLVTTTIVESRSGNLGAALSAVCKVRGYRFVCVTDPDVSPANLHAIRAIAARSSPSPAGLQRGVSGDPSEQGPGDCVANTGTLGDRDANQAGRAHAETTAREISKEFPKLKWLFVGTGD